MKNKLNFVFLCWLFAGCTHMRPIEQVSTPLTIKEARLPSIDSIRLQVNNVASTKGKFKSNLESLRERVSDALTSKGILISEKSQNSLELDVSRFMIVGDGLVFCQSVVELTARPLIRGKKLNPKRFSASRNGYFCAFGNSNEKMKESTKEALEQILSELLTWLANAS